MRAFFFSFVFPAVFSHDAGLRLVLGSLGCLFAVRAAFLFSESSCTGMNKGAFEPCCVSVTAGGGPTFVSCFVPVQKNAVCCWPHPGQHGHECLLLAVEPTITRGFSPFLLSVAILGMHTLMSNQQYYQALGSSTIVNKEGLNSK